MVELSVGSLVWALIAATIAALIVGLYRLACKKKMLNVIPGLPDYFLIGNLQQLSSDAAELYHQTLVWSNVVQHSGVTRTWLGPIPIVSVHSANAVEALLTSSKHINKSRDYEFLLPWLGLGLLTSTGEKWRARRHALTPAFHFEILRDFLPVINRHARILKDKLSEHMEEPFDIYPHVTLATLDVICETAMGMHMDAQNDSESEYVRAVYRASELIAARQRRPWLWPDILYFLLPEGRRFKGCLDVLHKFTNKVINERQLELTSFSPQDCGNSSSGNGVRKRRRAFLDLLLQWSRDSNGQLTLDDIREEVDTFMFEGHDTTSAGVVWSLYLIGRHPEVQARVHKELDAIFASSSRDVEHDDLSKLTYLECAIKEALRLYPPVPWYARALMDDTVLGGYKVPKSTTVMIAAHVLHRDGTWFPDPEKYDPGRFSAERSAQRHPFAYLPFSAGPRNCIGQKFAMMELKVILAMLLRHFTIESVQSPEQTAPVSELILKPSRGIVVRLLTRH